MTAAGDVAYLSRIAVRLGEPRPLAEVDDVREAGLAADLAAEGLVGTRIASGPARDLAVASLDRALDGAGRPDVVLYATTTCWADAAEVTARAGLSTVPLIGLTRNACANLVPALRVARSLLAAEADTGSVAVTTVDAAAGPRLMDGGIGVLSDGAASCLVTGDRPATGWAVTGLATANEFRLERDDGSEPARSADLAHTMGREIRTAISRLVAASGVTLDAYDVVLMNNYAWSTLAAFAKLVDVPVERLYDANRSSVSHCFGADPLIDLASLESDRPSPGTCVFALVCGPGVWGMFSLERV